MKAFPRITSQFLAICCLCSFCTFSRADTVKDALDQAKADYVSTSEAAQKDLTTAFDEQIKAISQTGNLDAVEQLRTQRQAFVTSQTLPTASAMRVAVANYQKATSTADASLKAAYETALSDYTKAGQFDDAEQIKRTIAERFAPPATAPTTKPSTGDPILDALEKSKQEFVTTVTAAHADVLAVIDSKAKAAAANGDLDGYNAFSALAERVKSEILVPDDVKDTAIRGANAKFVRISEAAYQKLRIAYQTAISDYTKAQRIEEAEAIRAELQDGGWFSSFTGRPATVDLLKMIDLSRDTLHKGWRFNEGALEPTAWDDEHGPAVKIPLTANGSYLLEFQFTLHQAEPGLGSLYLHLPVGSKWANIELMSGEQSLNIGSRQFPERVLLPLGKLNDASVRVTLLDNDHRRVSLVLNGKQSSFWEGTADEITLPSDYAIWNLEDNSCFAVYTKTATLSQMRLSANPDTIKLKRAP